jgi:hypothetical protein
MSTLRRAAVLAALPILLVAAGCGGSSSGGSGSTTPTTTGSAASSAPAAEATAPADVAAASAEVTKNWTTFFNYKTPLATEYTLLQGGQALAPAIHKAQQEQQQTHLKQAVKVKKVEFTSPTQATVLYSLLNGTTVLLANSSGVSVLEDGTWKVSKITFCTLVQLGNGNKPVPSC